MGLFDGLVGKSFEESIIEGSTNIIKYASEANKELRKVIKGSGSVKEIKRIEEASDRAVFKISSSITSGGIPPNLIPDLLRFSDFEDNIVDSIFNLSRAYTRYKTKDKRINDYLDEQLLRTNSISDSAIDVLLKMHKASTMMEARALRFKIEKYEQQGDDIKDAMLGYAYGKKMDYKTFNHMLDLSYLADDIQDNCEDVSDRLVSILASIIS